ncbi:nitrite reductase large subunit NirB [Entomobacter blattae]|uniref:Nitrite reductase n=1 Tax=Entomobacter blattae TaxID=2762277 RepID=A0A7H1NPQ1_9PROT|nr:nitrite reductase large subunit NirB [Entomobacter blattae]QNT77761.1 Nitrite reductase [Entomobacter blattae]
MPVHTTSSLPTLIIVGNGMVGHYLVEQLIDRGLNKKYHIHIIGDEPYQAYDRVHLSEYIDNNNAETLTLCAANYHTNHNITLSLKTKVLSIARQGKTIETDKGTLSYDKLILATGSYPFVPPIPGSDGNAGLVYRTLNDLDHIREAANGAARGVVIGGGLLGLEAANSLKTLGLEVHIIEFANQLMPVQLDSVAGEALKKRIEELNIHIHLSHATKDIVPGQDFRYRLNFEDGTNLETDLVLFSAGIRPNDEIARAAGLEIAHPRGIAINDSCLTSDPDIFAIGDCAAWENRILGLIGPGYSMARVIADQLEGKEATFKGGDTSTKLKLLGVDVGSIGDAHGKTPGAKNYQFLDQTHNSYRKLVVSEDGEQVLGAILVGDNSYYDSILQYYLNGIKLPEDASNLILPSNSSAPTLSASALPETATICSCYNVTKGAIIQAIDGGCTDLATLKAQTKASTGCGGCASLLKDVFNSELTARGVEVDKSICEHFKYTRQELYAFILVEKITSFEELIQKHGNGAMGCDICKPAVASILASTWNELITKPDLIPLQETNDTFLANMQKNGTYSIVPRIAGGEITPDRLIALGQIAKKYHLYTKITGGQRIDLFGAQVHELPMIWDELIKAGFETGQAYGKSLRTVKTCVGNTWCRYGVKDSVGFGILLENRYKGLRSPHKIKFGVSGCTRECAEAQGKDIGIIATEKGWNLYVCGNGGMRPRHAELLASDLDDTTLIRYVDRFLMYYIRTADRLQRTSVWRENLEGGLDHIKDVVIHDKLGLAEELERQMQHVIDTYQCEWKATINDPEKVKRFRTFINDPATNPDIQTKPVREQFMPDMSTVIQNDEEGELLVRPKPTTEQWDYLCEVKDLVAYSGVVGLYKGQQVALFYLPHGVPHKTDTPVVYAIANHDPFTHADVIGHGILGDIKDKPVIASPLHKEHFYLENGACVEHPETVIQTWNARINGNKVEIQPL